jgi:aspartate aminotransferase
MVAPAGGFYSTPGVGLNQVRIAYVLKKEDLIQAVHILKEAIQVYNSKKKHLILKSADNENA